jgi:surface antigen/LysM repeat protein
MSTTHTVTSRLHLETGAATSGSASANLRTRRRRMVRYGLLAFNALILVSVGYMVLQSAGSPPSLSASSASSVLNAKQGNNTQLSDPLDRLSSADIAVNVARVANLPESVAVTNQADSENAQLAVVQASDSLVAKPQVVASPFKSNKDITVYTSKPGDSAASIAAQFHVTSDSILWSNDLAGDNVATGQKLYIPPVNGIVYVVKAGDTPESLASKYHTSKEKVIAFNDAEISGLQLGVRILIPDGQIIKPKPVISYSSGASSGFPWGGGAIYGSNGYIPGYCTFYVATRIAVPSNWGNANTWDNLAPRSGWTVSTVPQPGAIGQTDRGSEGHVAVIEDVRATDSGYEIKYSDMNGLAGYNRVGHSDWVSAAKFEHYISR